MTNPSLDHPAPGFRAVGFGAASGLRPEARIPGSDRGTFRNLLEPVGLFDACLALLVDLAARQWCHALPPLDPVVNRILAGRSTELLRPVGVAPPAVVVAWCGTAPAEKF